MIATETDIDRRFQKLYFENKNIELLVSLETTARELPKTSRENPLLLFSTLDVDAFNNQRIQNGKCKVFDHCVVRSSRSYGFYLPLWYLQTLLSIHCTFCQSGWYAVFKMFLFFYQIIINS